MTTKNLQQLLSKMTVESVDEHKEHKFWNTQPVPKLGVLVGRFCGLHFQLSILLWAGDCLDTLAILVV